MNKTKFARTVLKFSTLGLGLSFSLASFAQTLDLGELHKFTYRGQDRNRNRAVCVMDVSAIKRDFANRTVQTFNLRSEGTDFRTALILNGGQRLRTPDFALGNSRLQFNIPIEDYRVELVTDRNPTTRIYEIRVYDRSGVSGRDGLVLQCASIQTQAR